MIATMARSAFPLFASFFILLGCANPPARQPIFLAPNAGGTTALNTAAIALEQQGYSIALHDSERLMLATEWRYNREVLALTRHRILVQIAGEPAVMTITAPRESRHGPAYVRSGEEESAREMAQASVIGRLFHPTDNHRQ